MVSNSGGELWLAVIGGTVADNYRATVAHNYRGNYDLQNMTCNYGG